MKKTCKSLTALILTILAVFALCFNFFNHSHIVYAENNKVNTVDSFSRSSKSEYTFGNAQIYNDSMQKTAAEELLSTYSGLKDSTLYGEWSDSFFKYNCYAFALGFTDKFYEIGEKSGNKLEKDYDFFSSCLPYGKLLTPIEELADFVRQDLEVLGYTCIGVEQNTFIEPDSDRTLICVRKADRDFHFMKYVNGEWLHKPGNTWILKYNYVPNKDVDWGNECAVKKGGSIDYKSSEDYYTGDIYFITYSNVHKSYIKFYDDSYHSRECIYCSQRISLEPHVFKSYSNGEKRCLSCGYTVKGGIGQIYGIKEKKEK